MESTTKKFSAGQLFFADFPLGMVIGVVSTLLGTAVALVLCFQIQSGQTQYDVIARILTAIGLGAGVGFFGAPLLALPFKPMLRKLESENGAPFRVGEEVVLLPRRLRGRVGKIYEVWPDRHQVRVFIGEADQDALTDVFTYTEVCRST